MPKINLNETDSSNFRDQQFISISYYGKVNTPPQGGKTLKYKVTFTANGNLFYAIEVNEGQKISKPVNNPQSPSSELIFDRWILNGQPFDFENTIISSDLNLIATFKEQSSELFNENVTFDNIGYNGAMAYIMEPIEGIDDTHLYDVVVNNDELGEILNLTFPMMLQPGDPDEGMPDMYQGYVEEETPDGDYYVIQFMYIPDGIIEPEEFGPDPIYGMLEIGSPKLPVEGTPPQTIANTIIRYSIKTQYEVTYDFGEEQITKSYLEGTVLSLQNKNLPEIPEILENEKFVGYYHNNVSLVDQSVTVNSNITINGMISEDYAYELYEHFNINKEDYPYMNIAVDTHSSGYEYSIYFAHNYSIETINNIKYLCLKKTTEFPILYNKYIDWTEDVDFSTCINAVNIIKNNITELVEFTPLFPSPTARVISYNDNDYCNYINFNEWDMFTEDIGTYITTTPVLYTFNTPAKPIPPVIDNIYFDKAIADIKKYDVYNTNPIYANKKCKITIGENYEIDGFTGKGVGRNYFKPTEFINSIRIKSDRSTEDYNIEANFFQNQMYYSIPQSMITSDQDHFKIELVGDALPCGIYLQQDNKVWIIGDSDFLKGDTATVTLTSGGHIWTNNVQVPISSFGVGNAITIDVDSEYYDIQAIDVTAKITLSDSTSYTWQFDNIVNGFGGNWCYAPN